MRKEVIIEKRRIGRIVVPIVNVVDVPDDSQLKTRFPYRIKEKE